MVPFLGTVLNYDVDFTNTRHDVNQAKERGK